AAPTRMAWRFPETWFASATSSPPFTVPLASTPAHKSATTLADPSPSPAPSRELLPAPSTLCLVNEPCISQGRRTFLLPFFSFSSATIEPSSTHERVNPSPCPKHNPPLKYFRQPLGNGVTVAQQTLDLLV